MSQDYYQTLGINKNANADEIKKAYKKMAMKHHPDRNPDDPSAEAKFKDVQKAYETLSDGQKKTAYDQYGHQAFEQYAQQGGGFNGGGAGGFGADFDLSDILNSMFGGGGQRSRDGRARGNDVSYAVEITLEQAALGHDLQITIPAWSDCDDCGGSGAEKGSKIHTCGHCNGTGTINIRQGMFAVQQTCPYCQGKGKTFERMCRSCNGVGKKRKQKNLEIKIPAGIDHGMRIRSSGNGEPGQNGGASGDLFLEVHIKQHVIFERDENDLHCEIPIPFSVAALGGVIQVPTLTGQVEFTIPEGTQNDQIFRLRGKGIKHLRAERFGDLLVHTRIEVPVKLNAEQKKLLESFSSLMDNDHKTIHNPKTKGFMDKLKDFFD
jgi:molecular chaperone DnaJ